jgi:2'-5' RNA ligase
MPHICLIYPFVQHDKLQDSTEKLLDVCSSIPSFTIDLSTFGFFEHAPRSVTCYLDPLPSPALVSLQAAVQSSFPTLNDLVENGVFRPHLTVGQFPSKVLRSVCSKGDCIFIPL